jgi:hypothetical protein
MALPRARSAAVLAVLALCLAASACRWSVPADPGLNSLARARPRAATDAVREAPVGPRPTVDDGGMRSLYVSRCAGCHEPYDPASASAGEWPGILRRMAPRAGLFGAERDRLLAWLQANAR